MFDPFDRFMIHLHSIFIISLVVFLNIIPLTIGESFKCVKDGFFPDKRDCWIYHICVGSTHSVKACKEDLLFNPNKNECDWAMNVRAEGFFINFSSLSEYSRSIAMQHLRKTYFLLLMDSLLQVRSM